MPKKKPKTKIPKLPMKQLDYSDVKPPTRPAIDAMIENLHAAGKKKPTKDL